MSYSKKQVEQSVAKSPIGGGAPYNERDGKITPDDADISASNVEELKECLRGDNDIIHVEGGTWDWTDEHFVDIGDKTLVGGRGCDGYSTPIFRTDSRGYYGDSPYTLFHSFGSPRVSGINFIGARAGEEFTRWDYSDNLARGIVLRGEGGEIDNCNFRGWTLCAIQCRGTKSTVNRAEIHHNVIEEAYQLGYGYGVDIYRGHPNIHHNYMNECRHCIDGFGFHNSGYVAEKNIIGPNLYSHPFDMHCLAENSSSRTDNEDSNKYHLRAGGKITIRRNTVCCDTNVRGSDLSIVNIRGVPAESATVTKNRVTAKERPPENTGNSSERQHAWRQDNVRSNSYGDHELNDRGFTANFYDHDNQYGAPNTPFDREYGAPWDILNERYPTQLRVYPKDEDGNYLTDVFVNANGHVEKSQANEYGDGVAVFNDISIGETDILLKKDGYKNITDTLYIDESGRQPPYTMEEVERLSSEEVSRVRRLLDSFSDIFGPQ